MISDAHEADPAGHARLRRRAVCDPDDFKVYAGMASAARRARDDFQARAEIRRALCLAPGNPELQVNASAALISGQQRPSDSELPGDSTPRDVTSLQRALLLRPEFAAVWRLLAGPASELERVCVYLKRSCVIDPGDSVGAATFANQLWDAGQEDEALAESARAVGLVAKDLPGRAAILINHAMLLEKAGEIEAAIAALFRTLPAIDRTNRSLPILKMAKRMGADDLVQAVARRIMVSQPWNRQASQELAIALHGCEKYVEAITILARSLAVSVTHASTWVNLGRAHRQIQNLDLSEKCFQRAAAVAPQSSVAWHNMAVQARRRGFIGEASKLHGRAAVIEPNAVEQRYDRGVAQLSAGRLETGLLEHEYRWWSTQSSSDRKAGLNPSFDLPYWRGEAVEKSDLLVWGEQGIGDELWFIGYALKPLPSPRRIIECDARLIGLFRRSFPKDSVIPRLNPPRPRTADAQVQVPAGSLPYILDRVAAESPHPNKTLIAPTGYLRADPARVDEFRRRYQYLAQGRRMVGLSWRSIKPVAGLSFQAPLEEWEALLARRDLFFVSLQYGETQKELKRIKKKFQIDILDDPKIDTANDLDGLAAQVAALDCVVSIANSTVSLAHGLETESWVILRPVQHDWRYIAGQSRSPWLPKARLFWSRSEGDWRGVIARIASRIGA